MSTTLIFTSFGLTGLFCDMAFFFFFKSKQSRTAMSSHLKNLGYLLSTPSAQSLKSGSVVANKNRTVATVAGCGQWCGGVLCREVKQEGKRTWQKKPG